MRKLSTIILLVSFVVVGGAVLVASVEMPPPSKNIERVIPDDQLPR